MYVKNSRALIILILLCFGPLFGAWYLYTYHSDIFKTSMHHGTLIQPPHNINSLTKYKKWLIIYIAPKPCDIECQKVLYKIQQVHKTFGKDQRRIKQLTLAPSEIFIQNNIYLVDPLGNAFMYYPQDVAPRALKDDLARVLKISTIG